MLDELMVLGDSVGESDKHDPNLKLTGFQGYGPIVTRQRNEVSAMIKE